MPFLLLLLEKQSSLPRLRYADPLSHFFAQCRRTRGIPHRLRAIMHHDAHLRIMCKPIWGDLQSTVLAQGAIVAVECPAKLIYGLQYHPEVMHSDRGTPTLRHFLLQIAGMQPDWKIENILEEEMEKIRRTVCPEIRHVLRYAANVARSHHCHAGPAVRHLRDGSLCSRAAMQCLKPVELWQALQSLVSMTGPCLTHQ